MGTKSTKSKGTKAATLSVDYTPEIVAARDLAVTAGRAYKAYLNRGDGTLLAQCVEATRVAKVSGFLVDGRTPDALPGSVGKAEFGRLFGLSSGSEVTFWQRLASCLDAGVTIGDDAWKRLATRNMDGKGKPLPSGARLAKKTEVGKVIDDGGSLADIMAACDAFVADKATRAARPNTGTETGGESAQEGIPTSDNPVADALLSILGLDAACKRIPVEDVDGWEQVRKAVGSVMRRETTLRKPAKPASKGTADAAKVA